MRLTRFLLLPLLAVAVPSAQAGPLLYAACQTGCNTVAVACYAAAGFQFGTVVAAAAAPATVIGCNVALGACMAGCAATALIAPTP